MASSKPNATTTAKEHAETMNRLNMLLAKRSNKSFLKRSRPNTTPKDTTTTTKKKGSGFSSLANKPATQQAAAAATPSNPSKQNDNDDNLLDADFGSFNAGLGYVAPGKETAAAAAAGESRSAAETRDLRGKLLGKRAREQREEGAAARKRRSARDEESSDEDEGRSGIGKGKGKGKKRGAK